MSFPEVARYAVAALLTGVLVWASISDIVSRRIPNASVLAVLGLFVLWSLFSPPSALTGALIVGVISFVVFYLLYAFKIMGAGDAKLFAAVSLFAGPAFFGPFTMGTVFAGGLMAIAALASRPQRALVIWQMRGRGDFGRGIPYGCAIAAGGIVMIWGQVLGLLTPYSVFGFIPA